MKKKNFAALLGCVGAALIVLAWMLATGADNDPVQAVFCLLCVGGANLSFRYAAKES